MRGTPVEALGTDLFRGDRSQVNICCSKRKRKKNSTVALSRDTSLYFSLLSALKDRFFAERRTAKQGTEGKMSGFFCYFFLARLRRGLKAFKGENRVGG